MVFPYIKRSGTPFHSSSLFLPLPFCWIQYITAKFLYAINYIYYITSSEFIWTKSHILNKIFMHNFLLFHFYQFLRDFSHLFSCITSCSTYLFFQKFSIYLSLICKIINSFHLSYFSDRIYKKRLCAGFNPAQSRFSKEKFPSPHMLFYAFLRRPCGPAWAALYARCFPCWSTCSNVFLYTSRDTAGPTKSDTGSA